MKHEKIFLIWLDASKGTFSPDKLTLFEKTLRNEEVRAIFNITRKINFSL